MKNLFIICALLVGVSHSFAQNGDDSEGCPPGVWCHPPGGGWGFLSQEAIDLATGLGEAFNSDPCAGQDYATQIYCYPAKWLADAIPCMYGEGTPQATLCKGGTGGGNPGGPGGEEPNPEPSPDPGGENPPPPPPPTEETPQSEDYYMTPGTTPFILKNKNANTWTKKYFDKKKRGAVVHKWKEGFTLRLTAKLYPNKSEKDYMVIMQMTNRKGQVVGNPTILTRNNKLYLVDLVQKKKKKRRK